MIVGSNDGVGIGGGTSVRLSVIIPGYNTSNDWWRRSVSSVLKQTGPNDEIICVDDGSRVKPSVLEELAENDTRVRVLYLDKNLGLAAARNAAMGLANGRFLTFVDSDDEVSNNVYEKVLSQMHRTNSAVGVFGVRVVWVRERLVKHDLPENKSFGVITPVDVDRLLRKCLLNYACNKVYDTHKIISKDSAWDFRFDELGMPCEDIIFNLCVLRTGVEWCGVDVEGYIYYRTDGTLLSSYKATNSDGEKRACAAWSAYCSGDPEKESLFADRMFWSYERQARSDWLNIWRQKSPFGLVGRYVWLKRHPSLGGPVAFVKMLARQIVRRYLYFNCFRRARIKRMFPNVEDVK